MAVVPPVTPHARRRALARAEAGKSISVEEAAALQRLRLQPAPLSMYPASGDADAQHEHHRAPAVVGAKGCVLLHGAAEFGHHDDGRPFHAFAQILAERGEADRQARRVALWLRRVQSDVVAREEIRRDALCQTVDAGTAEALIERLERYGVLRPLAVEPSSRRGPHKRRWEVNPELRAN